MRASASGEGHIQIAAQGIGQEALIYCTWTHMNVGANKHCESTSHCMQARAHTRTQMKK